MVSKWGVKTKRPTNCATPCRDCPKIPPGAPATPYHAVELDARGWAAWNYYRQCKAVGRFPGDAAVTYMAGIFARIEEQCREAKDDARFLQLSRALMTAATVKGLKG